MRVHSVCKYTKTTELYTINGWIFWRVTHFSIEGKEEEGVKETAKLRRKKEEEMWRQKPNLT